MLNLHSTIYSQSIDESKIKGSFTKEQRNNILIIEEEHTDPTYFYSFAAYVKYYLWSISSTNH
jgi:hypothetical protein